MMRAFPSEARKQAKSTKVPKAHGAERPRRWQLRGFSLVPVVVLLIFPLSNPMARIFRHRAKAKASALPEVRIPVEALGYTAPGALPALDFHAMVGVYYIDANHLLFTFDLKRLLRRDNRCSGASTQRIVRAVVLDIPSGKVEKQADWELYDFSDYLWSLGNGQFLLRRCSQLEIVGASLDPRPLIDPSGAVKAIGFSPDRSMMVVEEVSRKTSSPAKTPPSSAPFPAGNVDVEFIRLHPLGVVARARLPAPAVVPIVATGILEALTAPHDRIVIDIQAFHGADRKVATLDSTCLHGLTAITNEVIVAGTCSDIGDSMLQAFDWNGSFLWKFPLGDRRDPRFLLTQNGAHFAIESVHTKNPSAPLDQLDKEAVDSEVIDIYDTRTGMRIGGFRTTPVYTAGKNADFSPDGTRMAVLHDGAIEIYTLDELAKNR